jgi:hypothetical protein
MIRRADPTICTDGLVRIWLTVISHFIGGIYSRPIAMGDGIAVALFSARLLDCGFDSADADDPYVNLYQSGDLLHTDCECESGHRV